MQPITIGAFDFIQDEKGGWIHKSNFSSSLSNNKEKPKYKEKPEYQLQETIEGESKKKFSKATNVTVLEVTKFIKDNI